MDSTALVAFIFEAPFHAQTVELLGSWDNFATPYRMQMDTRKGALHWTGCFSFNDIVFDGDLYKLSSKRNGGLRMGGTYWYYYRIDGDVEYHDPRKPATTSCPLLPGQSVNLLEIPFDSTFANVKPGAPINKISYHSAFTLDPNAKFLLPKPVPETPRSLSPSPARRQAKSARLAVSAEDLRAQTRVHLPPSPVSPPDSSGFLRSAPAGKAIASRPSTSRGADARKTKSASGSPSLSFKSAFALFKGERPSNGDLKSSGSSERGRSRRRRLSRRHSAKELEIGRPVLISRTDEGRYCIPLSSPEQHDQNDVPQFEPQQPAPGLSSNVAFGMSPLKSNPVDADKDILETLGQQHCWGDECISPCTSNAPQRSSDDMTRYPYLSDPMSTSSRAPSPFRNPFASVWEEEEDFGLDIREIEPSPPLRSRFSAWTIDSEDLEDDGPEPGPQGRDGKATAEAGADAEDDEISSPTFSGFTESTASWARTPCHEDADRDVFEYPFDQVSDVVEWYGADGADGEEDQRRHEDSMSMLPAHATATTTAAITSISAASTTTLTATTTTTGSANTAAPSTTRAPPPKPLQLDLQPPPHPYHFAHLDLRSPPSGGAGPDVRRKTACFGISPASSPAATQEEFPAEVSGRRGQGSGVGSVGGVEMGLAKGMGIEVDVRQPPAVEMLVSEFGYLGEAVM
ncbi:hypothetical protein BDY21DRAFT_1332 [Lineolata rhizophorae]|uniref:Uncharacterized protein n=1 Tax=Lineolata rhizophorae TaxID=578093 RepID=A0A6A6PCU6_9PEZI|nr:hypothetical protein BDY21DRAFT_1332 [Lineolata rhizophorae]